MALGAGAVSAQDIVFQAGNKATADALPAPVVIESSAVTYDGQECLGQPNQPQLTYADYNNGGYSGIKYKVTAPSAGEYGLEISYYTVNQRYIAIQVGDQKENIIRCAYTNAWSYAEGNTPATSTVNVWLEQGDNVLKISTAPVCYNPAEDKGYAFLPNIYKFAFTKVADSNKTAADFAAVAPIFVEAESGYNVSAYENRSNFHSNGGAKNGISLDKSNYANYRLNIPSEGVYLMRIWYCTMQNRPFVVSAEDYPDINVNVAILSSDWNTANAYMYIPVYMKKGSQTLKLSGNGSDNAPVIDCFEITPLEAAWYAIPEKDTTVKYPQHALSTVAKYSSNIFTNLNDIHDFNEYTSATSDKTEGTVTVEFPWNILITGYGIATGNNTANWELEHSADGENWTSLEMPVDFYKFSTKALSCNNESNLYNEVVATRYVRLTISGDEAASLGEFTIYGYPYVSATAHNPSGLVTAENYTSNDNGWPNATGAEGIGHMFDGLNTTWWTRNDANDPVEITVKLDEPCVIDSYLMAIPYRSSQTARNLKEWTLSDDDEELSKVDDMNWISQGAAVIIPVNQTTPSDTYKLTIPRTKVNQPHMSGFQLFSMPDTPTGVDPVFVNAVVKVVSLKGSVSFEGEAGIAYGIYTANGTSVAAGVIAEGANSVALPQGLYIVKIGDKAVKVIVK